jgi:predicted metal-dependent peptidase
VTRRKEQPKDPNTLAFEAAWRSLASHPMFAGMTTASWPQPAARAGMSEKSALFSVDVGGVVRVGRSRKLDAGQWRWVLAHCLLHLGFGHLDDAAGRDRAYQEVACLAVARFQRAVKLGREPVALPRELPATDEAQLLRAWRRDGVPAECFGFADLRYGGDSAPGTRKDPQWQQRFAVGLSAAAVAAVEVAGGARTSITDARSRRRPWQLALSWFVASYPLLGAIAARFTLVADANLARDWDIAIAAVSAEAGEIYVNPLRTLGEQEWRFVLAHEMLHAALRHGDRAAWRDRELWNVACDYVVNGWLVEMGVGQMPEGLLHDPALAGMSAEDVYDRLATDLRRARKLLTSRGDILGEPLPWHGPRAGAVDLAEYCRRALLTGYAYHLSGGRGWLPAGLVAEVRVLEQPPLPWDVRLARWFDEHVPSPVPVRSYARASRRQASTPDIPRPGRRLPEEVVERCTFGVVVDTSGSMSHELMGKALGAIASYSKARDVPAARVIFCDAAAYDAGYLPVDEIAGRVRVRGRGGTTLQPAISLLDRAEDFPPGAPVLVITDGECDVLRVRRTHAYLMPRGARLPFTPRGEVFDLR